jgi:Holliday junction resolvasome RuvABC endonuclease subunit
LGLSRKTKKTAEPLRPKFLYIGIDQSYSGFGLVVLDENMNSHQKSLLKYPKKANQTEAQRLVKIYDDLLMYFSMHLSSGAEVHIAMEGYAFGAKLNREKLGELGGIVKLASRLVLQQDPISVPPTILKQYVTGKGTATKEEMVLAVQKWDAEITDNNLADAYGLAHMLYTA